MEKQIWKYQLEVTTRQTIRVPKGAEILVVQKQRDTGCLWIMVDPQAKNEDRVIETFGTGHPVDYNMGSQRKYIGTYQQAGGTLIWHVFEYTGV